MHTGGFLRFSDWEIVGTVKNALVTSEMGQRPRKWKASQGDLRPLEGVCELPEDCRTDVQVQAARFQVTVISNDYDKSKFFAPPSQRLWYSNA